MTDYFLYAILPYLAVATLIVGSVFRFLFHRYSWSALSSQFLENNAVFWGSMPWHIGIGIILAGHLVAFFLPGLWSLMTNNYTTLVIIETIGLGLAVITLFGLTMLFLRRMLTPKIRVVTSAMDWVILSVLMVQIILGLLTAVLYPFGSAWATGVLSPYLLSFFSFDPQIAYVTDLPLVVKLHMTFAWILLLLVPFSRLVHAFSLPFRYFVRPPQLVIWNRNRP